MGAMAFRSSIFVAMMREERSGPPAGAVGRSAPALAAPPTYVDNGSRRGACRISALIVLTAAEKRFAAGQGGQRQHTNNAGGKPMAISQDCGRFAQRRVSSSRRWQFNTSASKQLVIASSISRSPISQIFLAPAAWLRTQPRVTYRRYKNALLQSHFGNFFKMRPRQRRRVLRWAGADFHLRASMMIGMRRDRL